MKVSSTSVLFSAILAVTVWIGCAEGNVRGSDTEIAPTEEAFETHVTESGTHLKRDLADVANAWIFQKGGEVTQGVRGFKVNKGPAKCISIKSRKSDSELNPGKKKLRFRSCKENKIKNASIWHISIGQMKTYLLDAAGDEYCAGVSEFKKGKKLELMSCGEVNGKTTFQANGKLQISGTDTAGTAVTLCASQKLKLIECSDGHNFSQRQPPSPITR